MLLCPNSFEGCLLSLCSRLALRFERGSLSSGSELGKHLSRTGLRIDCLYLGCIAGANGPRIDHFVGQLFESFGLHQWDSQNRFHHLLVACAYPDSWNLGSKISLPLWNYCWAPTHWEGSLGWEDRCHRDQLNDGLGKSHDEKAISDLSRQIGFLRS